jgi:hypothetical protein
LAVLTFGESKVLPLLRHQCGSDKLLHLCGMIATVSIVPLPLKEFKPDQPRQTFIQHSIWM